MTQYQTKYHISPRTGNPMPCKAKTRCPFGNLVTDHFDSKEEARAAYEQKMNLKHRLSYEPGKLKVSSLPEDIQVNDNTVMIPRGMYVLGDATLTTGRKDPESWARFENELMKAPRAKTRTVSGACLNDYPIIMLRTKYGNGIYFDNAGRDYPVDSERLALTPLTFLKKIGMNDEEIQQTSSIVVFNEPTKVKYSDGTISFGENLQVFTDEEPMEDDEVSELLHDDVLYEIED